MSVSRRLGALALTVGMTVAAGWAMPYPAQAIQEDDTAAPQESASAEPLASTSARKLIDPRLGAVAAHLRRLTDLLRERGHPQAVSDAPGNGSRELAERASAELQGLQSLELILEQAAVVEQTEMERLRIPGDLRAEFQRGQHELRGRLSGFRARAARFEAARAAGDEAAIDAALADLGGYLQDFDATKPLRLDPDSVRSVIVKPEERAPAQSLSELESHLVAAEMDESTVVSALPLVSDATRAPELSESDEVQLTPEIRALADQLEGNPVRIFNWVRNNIDYHPTFGAIQGAALTLVNRRGNAADTNTLLVALLRAADVPARFVYGTVDVPANRVANWVGTRTAEDAVQVLLRGGIPATLIKTNGAVTAVRIEHVWAEAHVDFVPSRGAVNRTPDAWVPLDASFKQYATSAPVDLLGLGDWDATAARERLVGNAVYGVDGSVTGLDVTAYGAYVDAFVDSALAQAEPVPTSPDLILGQRRIVASELPVLAGTLPFRTTAAMQRFAALPRALKYFLEVNLYATERDIAYENPQLTVRVPTVSLIGQSVFVDYVPSTAEGALALESYRVNNAASLPAGSFHVMPLLKLGEQTLAQGGAVGMGTMHYWTAGVVDPSGRISGVYEPYRFPAGSHISFTPDLGGITPEALDGAVATLPDVAQLPIAQALHLAGLQYWHLNDSRAELNAQGWGGHFLRLPSVGVFAQPLQVRYFFGIPRTAYYAGYATDIKADRVAAYHADSAQGARMVLQMGAGASYAESLTWDLLLDGRPGDALSATSILAWANQAKVPIHTITQANLAEILPKLQTTADVRDEIRNAVSAGLTAIAPEREFSDGKTQAMGYVLIDPETGGALYRVDGGLNGAIKVGCIARAVVLTALCKSKFAKLLAKRLALLAAKFASRFAIGAAIAAVAAPIAPLLPIIAAVIITVEIIQTAYEITRWVKEVMEGITALTPEEMAELGIDALNEAICNYHPACFNNPLLQGAVGLADSAISGIADAVFGADGPAVGNPVTTGKGIKVQTEVDYRGEGPYPLEFVRQYVSYLPNGSPIGHKWVDRYHVTLRLPADANAMAAPEAVLAQRPDGGLLQFVYRSGQFVAKGDVPERIERLNDGLGRTTGWRYYTVGDEVETYDADGRLLSIRNRTGLTHALSYGADGHLSSVQDDYGRHLRFEYDAVTGQVVTMTDPENRAYRYSYDDYGSLVAVTYPDQTVRRYHYETPGRPSLLTGITDERDVRFASWKYDASNRVIESAHAEGVDTYQLAYGDRQTTVTDPRGTGRTYHFQLIHDTLRATRVSEPCSSCSAGGSASVSYDGNGYPAAITDFNGNRTRLQVNPRGLPELIVRAEGKPEAQTVRIQWHPDWRVPTQVTETSATGGGRTIAYRYDERGSLATRTITADGRSRVWSYRHNEAGQVLEADGPRTDVSDVTTYAYDPLTGNRTQMVDPSGLVTRYTRYDAGGRLLEMVDANGLVTEYRYDARDRLLETRVGPQGGAAPEVTRFEYDAVGNLAALTLPDGSALHYSYDAAQRLIAIADEQGSRIAYTLNAAGDRVQEETFDPTNTLAQTVSRVVDRLGRLEATVGAAPDEITRYTYDGNGNELAALAPLHDQPTRSAYDALDRLVGTADPAQGEIAYRYDAQNNLRAVVDPRGLTTGYTYDGFNELRQLDSPDTGTTRYQYDDAGNLAARTDARDIVASYAYDAANRLRQIGYPDERLDFSYDAPEGGAGALGRLTGATATPLGTGSTAIANGLTYVYDSHGRVIGKTQSIGATPSAAAIKTVRYDYAANGHLDALTLPSGAEIRYGYGADGRVMTLTVNGVTVVRDVEYFPFGEPRTWLGIGSYAYARAFDRDGRIEGHSLARDVRTLGYDAAERIVALGDARQQWRYDYDPLDRLIAADNTGASGAIAGLQLAWDYDGTGNRLSQRRAQGGAGSDLGYTIDPASNRLLQITGALEDARQYDAAGNTTSWRAQLGDSAAPRQAGYSGRNRLAEVRQGALVLARYAYNAFGERVASWTGAAASSTPGAAPSAQYVYDEAGHLLGEYDSAGNLIAEHLWLDDTPVAVLKPAASAASHGGEPAGNVTVYAVISDHLDTPREIVNVAGAVVWRWESAPFGDTPADENASGLGAFAYRLRFPGQVFDVETGGHYNYFRAYEPGAARYLESDLIGLAGGLGTYTYGLSSPLSFVDRLGLCPKGACDNTPRPLCEWLSDQPELLREATELHATQPQWQGINPYKDKVFYRCKEDVDEVRKRSGESGGHHPHGLALGGPSGQKLTPTGETRSCKNKCHIQATRFQMKLLRIIKCKLGF